MEPYIDRYYKGGKFNLSIGEYTDDTAMVLCLAQSLIECNGLNQKEQLEKYVKWFKEGLVLAVNLENDSDTIGVIYGQLAGAFYGEENIDEYLKENLKNKNLIEEIALKLFELSNKKLKT